VSENKHVRGLRLGLLVVLIGCHVIGWFVVGGAPGAALGLASTCFYAAARLGLRLRGFDQ
jgi:hypothetical protein